MLIRFRPEDAARVIKRKGQENFNYGDLYAYSKICTHLGCPTRCTSSRPIVSSARARSSQFDALRIRKPVFGPARALRNCPSPWTARGTSSPTVTSSSRSDLPTGSVVLSNNSKLATVGDNLDSGTPWPRECVGRSTRSSRPTGPSCWARSPWQLHHPADLGCLSHLFFDPSMSKVIYQGYAAERVGCPVRTRPR